MEKNVGFNIIDSKDWESVIEITSHQEAQKHLNQWRHEFDLMILSCVPIATGNSFPQTFLSVMRRKRS